MAKKKAEPAGNEQARIKDLEGQAKQLRDDLAATLAQLEGQTALLNRARETLRHVELSAAGIPIENVVIEHLIPAADEQEAGELCAMMLLQEGCLGGRPLPPRWRMNLRETWVAQVFWQPDAIPATPVLFGLFTSLLPEGQSYRLVPASQRRALGMPGINPAAAPPAEPDLEEAAEIAAAYAAAPCSECKRPLGEGDHSNCLNF